MNIGKCLYNTGDAGSKHTLVLTSSNCSKNISWGSSIFDKKYRHIGIDTKNIIPLIFKIFRGCTFLDKNIKDNGYVDILKSIMSYDMENQVIAIINKDIWWYTLMSVLC